MTVKWFLNRYSTMIVGWERQNNRRALFLSNGLSFSFVIEVWTEKDGIRLMKIIGE